MSVCLNFTCKMKRKREQLKTNNNIYIIIKQIFIQTNIKFYSKDEKIINYKPL